MLFPTATFAAFFAVVFAAHLAFRHHRRPWMLTMLAASLVFYGWTDMRLIVLLVAASLVGHVSVTALVPRAGTRAGRWIVAASALVLLGALAVFKYSVFFTSVAADLAELLGAPWGVEPPTILLPIGISFITFQVLGYCVDAYRGSFEEAPPLLDSMLFAAFFPQLVAGPILRARPFLDQMRVWPRQTGSTGLAAFLIIGGLVKKVIVADALFEVNVAVHANPDGFSALDNAVSLYAGMIRVFCDVSSYTDIALGVALLLGVKLPENFNRPFAASSISEFWRRWHISMSNWFRDYLFRPLSGRSPTGRRLIVAGMVTMVLSGLWHGAAWGFVLWGFLHGLVLVAEGAWRVRRVNRRRAAVQRARLEGSELPPRPQPSVRRQKLNHVVGVVLTFHFIVLTGSLFLGNTPAECWHKVELLVGDWGSTALVTPLVALALIVPMICQFVPWRLSAWLVPRFDALHPAVQGAAFAVAATAVFAFASPGVAPYLYYGV